MTASSEIIDYEIYTLSVDGYYASPERDATNPEMISSNAEDPFDYRGEENLDMWTKIAEGQITSDAGIRIRRTQLISPPTRLLSSERSIRWHTFLLPSIEISGRLRFDVGIFRSYWLGVRVRLCR